MLKTCGGCARTLPVTSFNRHKGGWQSRCRECHGPVVKANSKKRRGIFREFLAGLKARRGGACELCGRSDRGLEFDHRRPETKKFCVNFSAASRSFASIELEAAKCQLLCHTCHNAKTQAEKSIRKDTLFAPVPDTSPGISCSRCARRLDASAFRGTAAMCRDCQARRRRQFAVDRRAWINSFKDKCCECGSDKDLEFDHVRGGKCYDLSKMITCSRAFILSEIAKCEVVCRTCHCRRTAARRSVHNAPGLDNHLAPPHND